MSFTDIDESFLEEYLKEDLSSTPNIQDVSIKKKCKLFSKQLFSKHLFSKNVFLFNVNTLSSCCSFLILLCISIFGLVLFSDVTNILKNAKGTLKDLNVILPEVHNTMTMLQHLCNTPEFKYYCYPNETS